MNDPHVIALVYRVEHDPGVDFTKAVPLIHETARFSVRVEIGRARFEMKEHFATVEEARQDVDAFVDAWRLAILLQIGPGIFSGSSGSRVGILGYFRAWGACM